MINITAFIKDGGYETLQITPKMLGELAELIKKKGSEYITLKSGVVHVEGFMVTGKGSGTRVIMLNSDKVESEV